MFNKILVVCIGNICRSPIGKQLIKKHFPNKQIASAGIHALVGKPADESAINIALENNVTLDAHIAQQLTAELCQRYDLILVMEKEHIDSVCRISSSARGKTMLFGHWCNGISIPDPYRQSQEAFEYVYQQLERSAAAWVGKL